MFFNNHSFRTSSGFCKQLYSIEVPIRTKILCSTQVYVEIRLSVHLYSNPNIWTLKMFSLLSLNICDWESVIIKFKTYHLNLRLLTKPTFRLRGRVGILLTDNLIVFVPDGHCQQRVDAGIHDAVGALVLVDVENFSRTRHPLRQALQVPRHVLALDFLPGTVIRRKVY